MARIGIVREISKENNGTRVTLLPGNGETYLITRNLSMHGFTLWRVLDEGYERLATADSPFPLYEKAGMPRK